MNSRPCEPVIALENKKSKLQVIPTDAVFTANKTDKNLSPRPIEKTLRYDAILDYLKVTSFPI